MIVLIQFFKIGLKYRHTSLDNVFAKNTNHISALAERILGQSVSDVTPVLRGRNSQVYRIVCKKKIYAVKIYPQIKTDARDRIGAEFTGLLFLHRAGVGPIPKPIGQIRKSNCAIYEWVNGAPVKSITKSDIDAAISFICDLHKIRTAPGAMRIRPASEACLSGMDVETQIELRFQNLKQTARENTKLENYLDGLFAPAFKKISLASKRAYFSAGLDFSRPIKLKQKTLSPSDFGFHNAIKQQNNSLVFMDFEYFGWDDPVKLTCDFLLHPAMKISNPLKRRFLRGAFNVFDADKTFRVRTAALFPLYGLRWCMILLNEFNANHWKKRVHAGTSFNQTTAQSRQLVKAEKLLFRLHEHHGIFTDGN